MTPPAHASLYALCHVCHGAKGHAIIEPADDFNPERPSWQDCEACEGSGLSDALRHRLEAYQYAAESLVVYKATVGIIGDGVRAIMTKIDALPGGRTAEHELDDANGCLTDIYETLSDLHQNLCPEDYEG